MLSSRGRGKDVIMPAVSIVRLCRLGGLLLAGLGLVLVVGWMLSTAWSCACEIDDPAVMARPAAAPVLSVRPIALRGDDPPQERISAARSAPSTPIMVDRS